MPINVIKIEPGDNRHHITFKPGIAFVNNAAGSRLVIHNEKQLEGSNSAIHNSGEVYSTSEIKSQLAVINNEIEKVKNNCNSNISNSLGSIQAQLTNLKTEIMNSTTFRNRLKNEILEELRKESNEQ